jgi:hypothetical protein
MLLSRGLPHLKPKVRCIGRSCKMLTIAPLGDGEYVLVPKKCLPKMPTKLQTLKIADADPSAHPAEQRRQNGAIPPGLPPGAVPTSEPSHFFTNFSMLSSETHSRKSQMAETDQVIIWGPGWPPNTPPFSVQHSLRHQKPDRWRWTSHSGHSVKSSLRIA